MPTHGLANAQAVFDALQRLALPSRRREIERAAGLGRRSTEKGLAALRLRGVLVFVGARKCHSSTYALTPGACRPETTLRGRYERRPVAVAVGVAIVTPPPLYRPAAPALPVAVVVPYRPVPVPIVQAAAVGVALAMTSCALARCWR